MNLSYGQVCFKDPLFVLFAVNLFVGSYTTSCTTHNKCSVALIKKPDEIPSPCYSREEGEAGFKSLSKGLLEKTRIFL